VRKVQRENDSESGSKIQREAGGHTYVCGCDCGCVRACVYMCVRVDVFIYTYWYGNERVRECVSMSVCVQEIVRECERGEGAGGKETGRK